MGKARKDSKGRALRSGETYRKTGNMYQYAYTDPFGRRKFIYSKDLMKLREKEERLLRDQLDGLDVYTMGKATVSYVFDRYISFKAELRDSTRSTYLYTFNHFVRDTFGDRKIAEVKYSDVLYFYRYLIDECDLAVGTLESINTILKPTFQFATENDAYTRPNLPIHQQKYLVLAYIS